MSNFSKSLAKENCLYKYFFSKKLKVDCRKNTSNSNLKKRTNPFNKSNQIKSLKWRVKIPTIECQALLISNCLPHFLPLTVFDLCVSVLIAKKNSSNCKIFLSKLSNLFAFNLWSIATFLASQGLRLLCICPNRKMYLFKLQNTFSKL